MFEKISKFQFYPFKLNIYLIDESNLYRYPPTLASRGSYRDVDGNASNLDSMEDEFNGYKTANMRRRNLQLQSSPE